MGLPMDLQLRNATGGVPETMVCGAAIGPPIAKVTMATVLRLAAWAGLIAGFLDVGLLVINRRLIDRDFYRLGGDFAWLIPVGVTLLMLVPAIVLILIARMRGEPVRLGVAVGVLSFVGFLDMSARLPLHLWASLLLCGGLATQLARLAGRRPSLFLQLVRGTVPLLAGGLLLIILATIGRRNWSENRALSAVPPSLPGANNVLLIVWDTVRPSNLSLHGYVRPTTPNLERLAGCGVRFDLAFSTSSWTLPAHASLFTGRWPHELGADWKSPLRDDVPTLGEYLATRGYDTAGFAANLDYCNRETGLARGFAHYEDFPIGLYEAFTRYVALGNRLEISDWGCVLGMLLERCFGRSYHEMIPRSREHAKNAAAVDRAFLERLKGRQGRRRPFFAFLNYNDAHTPYEVPDRSVPGFGLRPASSRDRLSLLDWHGADKSRLEYHDVRMAADIYDDCISYLDRRLGILLNELSRRGVLDDTLVIATADHGEHLGDHLLFFHGCSLYRQLVQVPLVIVGPKGVPANRVVALPVSLRDIPATVVDLLGLARDAPFPGQSLARFWAGKEGVGAHPETPLLVEISKPALLTNQGREPAAKGPMQALVAGGMHYIRMADGLEELFVLNSDPEEQFNVAGAPSAWEPLRRFRTGLSAMFKGRWSSGLKKLADKAEDERRSAAGIPG
jgi:arylsulfatase A-like enzyme